MMMFILDRHSTQQWLFRIELDLRHVHRRTGTFGRAVTFSPEKIKRKKRNLFTTSNETGVIPHFFFQNHLCSVASIESLYHLVKQKLEDIIPSAALPEISIIMRHYCSH